MLFSENPCHAEFVSFAGKPCKIQESARISICESDILSQQPLPDRGTSSVHRGRLRIVERVKQKNAARRVLGR